MTTTYKKNVYDALKRRAWVSSDVINSVGGASPSSRIHELRSEGFEIKTRKKTASGDFEYRLISKPEYSSLYN